MTAAAKACVLYENVLYELCLIISLESLRGLLLMRLSSLCQSA